jgi:hypothetical protein
MRDRPIGGGENLCCRHPADINQPVPKGVPKTDQLLDIPVAVLETNHIRTRVRQPSHGVEFE